VFGRATITLGIGPHSSCFSCCSMFPLWRIKLNYAKVNSCRSNVLCYAMDCHVVLPQSTTDVMNAGHPHSLSLSLSLSLTHTHTRSDDFIAGDAIVLSMRCGLRSPMHQLADSMTDVKIIAVLAVQATKIVNLL